MKKFLSNSLSGVADGLGDPLGVGDAPTVGAVVVVVVVVAGDIPGTVALAIVPGAAGVIPGTAGDVAVTGAVAGDMAGAVAGDMAGAVTGAVAGLVAVTGGGAGGRFVGGADAGGWPNEVSARVTEKRLAISSVFIGLIRELSRPRIPMSWVSS
jgi:hypothetical protein